MSRIQEILAKAEREGTTRRTQPTPFPPASAPFSSQGAPAIEGTSALNPTPFGPLSGGTGQAVATPVAPPVATPVAAPTTEVRTAAATLHRALISAINPHSDAAEQYRTLRARLAAREDGTALRTLLITSPGEGDGKSVTAANLALTMAQEFQRRVVLVDGHLRGGAVHSLFGLTGAPGLAEVLADEASLDDVMVYLPELRLTVIPAGNAPQFPTELLGSAAMRRVIDTLRARFDRVLLDMGSVLPLADVSAVTPMADGVLMVVRAGVTQRPALDQALAAFEEEKVLGIVLNQATN